MDERMSGRAKENNLPNLSMLCINLSVAIIISHSAFGIHPGDRQLPMAFKMCKAKQNNYVFLNGKEDGRQTINFT